MQTKESKEQRIRHVAIHEAGHAVMATLLDTPFDGITIVPDGESLGAIIYDQHPLPSLDCLDNAGKEGDFEADRAGIERIILLQLAGPMAEEVCMGDQLSDGMEDDHKQAIGLAIRLAGTGDEASALLDKFLGRVRETLSAAKGRQMVEQVACTLIDKKTLSEREVKAILEAEQKEVGDGT